MTRFVPIYSEENRQYFMAQDLTPPKEILLNGQLVTTSEVFLPKEVTIEGQKVLTAPVVLGMPLPLLRLSESYELIQAGVVDATDVLSDVVVNALYFLVKTGDRVCVVRSHDMCSGILQVAMLDNPQGSIYSGTFGLFTAGHGIETKATISNEEVTIKAYLNAFTNVAFGESHITVSVIDSLADYTVEPIACEVSFRRENDNRRKQPVEITWEMIETSRDFDQHEYGRDVVANHGGIPPNCSITYIPLTFLNGLVNYLENRRAFIINRHGFSDYGVAMSAEQYRSHLTKGATDIATQPHAKLKRDDLDDIIVFGQTDNSYYMLWYDRTALGSIARVAKTLVPTLTYDAFIEVYMRDLAETYLDWRSQTLYDDPIVVPIPVLRGTISG